MTKPVQFRRLLAVAILLACCFSGLAWRLVDLQVVRHEEFSARLRANTHRSYLLQARRGDIRDIHGNLLATSLPAKTICADPSLIGSHAALVARAIASFLGEDERRLAERIAPRTRTNADGAAVTNRYVVLQRRVPVETWQQIYTAMTNLTFGVDEKLLKKGERAFYRNLRNQAVFAEPVDDQIRSYPNGRLASHVLGYTSQHEVTNSLGRDFIEMAGADGIERVLNTQLSGVRGWRVTEADRRRRELVAFREQDVEPQDGLHACLTLDAGLQHIVESELAEAFKKHNAESISCIIIRPRTGELVALANAPDYDANVLQASGPEQRRNRAITDSFEPGSTFKMVVVSGALSDGAVTLRDRLDCENGRFLFAGKWLHDHGRHGVMSVEEIITKSSNIGAAKIAIKMGEAKLHEYIRNFGFGSRTGIPLPGEVGGIVHPLKNWNKLSISRVPMGHEIATTPIQTAYAMAAIANGGTLMRPMLVDRLVDAEGRTVVKYQPQPVRRVLSEKAAKDMVTALKTVPTKEGTAIRAAMELYAVAGKTGTAHKPKPGGYWDNKYFSSFIGFFPADAPELVISVVVDDPKGGEHFGGSVCGPIFRRIAERAANHLDIRPDVDPEKLLKDKKSKPAAPPAALAARAPATR